MNKLALSAGVPALLLAAAASAQTTTPAPVEHCSLPGQLITADPAGDATFIVAPDVVPDHDVLEVYVAELANEQGEQKVYFTLKIDSVGPVFAPASSYQVKFYLKDGVERFVLFNPYPTPSEAATATELLISNSDKMFAFGQNAVDPTTGNGTFSIDGEADAESSASAADGTITIVLSEKQLRQLQPGAAMTGIIGVSQFNGAIVTSDIDTSDAPGGYTLQGNASCSGAAKSGSKMFGGAFGFGLLLPLLGLFGLRRRA